VTQVLVCDGEQRSALAVVRSLGRAGHRVFVCSHRSTAMAFGSRYAVAEAHVPDPLVSSASYVTAVGALVERWGIEIVIPVTDQSSALLIAGKDGLHGARIPGPDPKAYARVADKSLVLAEAAAVGIATPHQLEVRSASEGAQVVDAGLRFPVVIKSTISVRGGARHTARYAADADQLAIVLSQQLPNAFPLLVQERIVGPGTGIFLLLWDGEILATFAHRRIRESPPSGGASVCCVSIAADPDLVALSKALLDRFEWRGVAMVEFKVDHSTGTPYLMEVNGRFWGSLQLAIDAGIDFPALLVAAVEGRPARASVYRTGVRLRWWWGDVDHLIARFRAGPAALDLPPGAPTRWQVVAQFLTWRAEQRWEDLRLDDPWPFVLASAEWFAARARGRAERIAVSLRALARSIFRLPERKLHPWRRRSAVRGLTSKPRPRSVLFVCYGNICRSPYAAAVARGQLPPAIAVASAGFFGPDRPPPREAIDVAAERGVRLAGHRSRLVSADLLSATDVIVVMDRQQRRRLIELNPDVAARVVLLGDLDPLPITRRDVTDPYGQSLATFRSCFDRIGRCVTALAAPWRGDRAPTRRR